MVSDHRGVARRIIFQTGKEFMTTLDNLCYSACSERIGQAGHGRGILYNPWASD